MRRVYLLLIVACLVIGVVASAAAAINWTKQTSPTTTTLRAVKVVSDKVVWAAGYFGEVYRTVNGGTTWQTKTVTDANYDNYGLAATDSLHAWIFGVDGNVSTTGSCKIWKTTDGGTTWTVCYTNNDSFSDAICFWDVNNGIALGDPTSTVKHQYVIVRTTDGGSTWNQVPDANIPPADSAADEVGITGGMVLLGDTVMFVSYGNSADIHPRVFKSTDRGVHWTASPRIALDNSTGYTQRDSKTGFICNFNGSAARSFDGWATSDSLAPFGTTYGLRAAVWFKNSQTILMVGGPTSAGISAISKDAGTTWALDTIPSGVGRLRWVDFLNPSTGWAVAQNGAIIKWTGSPLVGVKEVAQGVPEGYALEQNYPNPFNPSTTISYALPQQVRVTLTVYNMLGEQVALLADGVQAAGPHEVRFDASGLASGVYFYKIKAGDFVQTRKLVLLR